MKQLIQIKALIVFLFAALSYNGKTHAQQHPVLRWANSIGGIYLEKSLSVGYDKDGNVYITGQYTDTVDFNPTADTAYPQILVPSATGYIAKYSATGAFVWVKSLGSVPKAMDVDKNGNIFIAGSFSGTADMNPDPVATNNIVSAGSSDAFVARYDKDGKYVWARNIGGTGADKCVDVHVTATNLYITGSFAGTVDFNAPNLVNLVSSGTSDYFMAKYDLSGGYVWAKRIGGTSIDNGEFFRIKTDRAGYIYTACGFGGTVDYDPDPAVTNSLTAGGGRDIFLGKYTANGEYIWVRQMGSAGVDWSRGLAVDTNYNVYISGEFGDVVNFNPAGPTPVTLTSNGALDAFVAKYDSAGKCAWALKLGGIGDDRGHSVAFDAGGNVYLAGTFIDSVDFDPDVTKVAALLSDSLKPGFIAKYDAQGHYIWAGAFEGEVSTDIANPINSLAITPERSILLTGDYKSTIDFDAGPSVAFLTAKYYDAVGISATRDIFLLKMDLVCETITQFNEIGCGSFTFNNKTYLTSGSYTDTFRKAGECDSITLLNLTVNPIPHATITKTGIVLNTDTADSYQWINCDSNKVIVGALGVSYHPQQTGRYAAIITKNNCSDTSDCVFVDLTPESVGDVNLAGTNVQLYPNPASANVTVSLSRTLSNASIKLLDITGRQLQQIDNLQGSVFNINLASYSKGVYLLQIAEGNAVRSVKVIKE